MDRIAELIAKIQAKAEEARRIAAKADEDGWTAEDRSTVKNVLEEVRSLREELDAAKDGGDLSKQVSDLLGGVDLGFTRGTADPAGEPDHYASVGKGKTLGQAFVESAQYAAFRKQWPEGRIPERARVAMDPFGVKELISISGEEGGGQYLVPPQYEGLVDLLGRPEVHLRQLVSVRTTTSDLVEYVRQLTRENAADWVPEATDLSPDEWPTGETGIKPMGGFTFEIVRAPVDTVAEWIPITKRAVMDAGQLRGLIDQELRGDILDAEERAILGGSRPDGIEGLEATSGTQLQAFDTDIFVTTRKAKSKVIYGGFAQPTAYLIGVEDDEKIDLARDEVGRFYANGPFGLGPSTLWGLPRVVSTFLEPGEAWLADWRRAIIWDRQQATISVSDSHADFFVRNLLAVLGEQREAFGVVRPAAFVKIETE